MWFNLAKMLNSMLNFLFDVKFKETVMGTFVKPIQILSINPSVYLPIQSVPKKHSKSYSKSVTGFTIFREL